MASSILRSTSCALLLTCACTPESESTRSEPPQAKSIAAEQRLSDYLESQQSQAPEDLWAAASDELLWQALSQSDAIINARIDASAQPLLDELRQEGRLALLSDYPEISRQDLQVADFATLQLLREHPGVAQIEPAALVDPGMESRSSSNSGCRNAPDKIHFEDLHWIEPGARVPWNFLFHQIPAAWELSDGHQVTLGIVDTGSSDFQDAFHWNQWREGWSGDRFIERHGRYVDSIWRWKTRADGPHDRCGHGTFMSGILAAPRSGNAEPVGVAYRSNLVVYRATKDVLLNAYHEKKGVAKAVIELANRSDVRVISLSIGYLFHVGNIADAIRYAHRQGKMVVAAAGTSFRLTNGTGVVFPARMQETVAVTGLMDTPWIQACVDCHYGPEVDFSMVIQRRQDANRRSVAIGYRSGELVYAGGSSAATAMLSGIAALVWSRHPDWSAAQVRQRLEESSELIGRRDPNYGFGRINAQEAVQ